MSMMLAKRGDVASNRMSGYSREVMKDAPLGYWPMSEGSGATVLADRSGFNRHFSTLSSVTSGIAGGPVVEPDGKSAIISGSAACPVFFTGSGDICIEFFYWPTNVSVNSYIMSNGFSYGIVQHTGGAIKVELNGVLYTLSTFGPCPLLTWTHVAVTHVGGLWTFYLNGAFDRAPNFADPGVVASGNFFFGGGGVRNHAHCAFYSPAPSAARIAAHYAARSIR